MADGGYSVSTLGFDTFVLGVVAQKSGTTCVCDCLSKHPQCQMSTMKELHFFGTLFRSNIFNFDAQKNVIPRYDRMRKLPGEKARHLVAEFDKRIEISGEFDRYPEFFKNFFQNSTIRRMCDFPAIDYVESELEEAPNPARRQSFDLNKEECAPVYKILKPVHDGCREIFGDAVPDSWMKAP